jgi:putative heme-binding domain-containing protein
MSGDRHETSFTPAYRDALQKRSAGSLLVALFLIGLAVISIRVESRASATDLSAGADLFRSDCAGCHGRDATGARGPDLTRGTFRHAGDDASLFRVIARGIPGSPMPGALSLHSEPAVWQLVAYIRSLSHAPDTSNLEGAAAAGKHLFEQSGRCLTCHLVDGRGACLGPDLSGIGLARTKSALRLSLVRPSPEVDPAWWSVRLVDATGRVFQGRRMDEDTYSVRLLDARGQLRSFERATVRSIERIEASTMPGYGTTLTRTEIDDLVAYLSTLTRP